MAIAKVKNRVRKGLLFNKFKAFPLETHISLIFVRRYFIFAHSNPLILSERLRSARGTSRRVLLNKL